MRLLIAGSRPPGNPFEESRWNAKAWHALTKHASIVWDGLGGHLDEVVSGNARGADRLGEDWALSKSIPVKTFKPDWVRYPQDAPFRRNIDMAEYADVAIVLWDGVSGGSAHMIEQMTLRGKPCFVVIVKKETPQHGL